MSGKLVIRITSGPGSAERAGSALTVAATALSAGAAVDVFLMNDGVELALPGVIETMHLEHAPPLLDLWNQVTAGGSVYACTQCLLRRDLKEANLREGVTQAGAAALVASVMEDGAKELSF